MKVGDRITISAPRRGAARGTVLQICTPEQLPELQNAPDAAQIRELLAEAKVDALMLIEHEYGLHGKLAFFALHTPAGWYDLRRQKLTITPEGPDPARPGPQSRTTWRCHACHAEATVVHSPAESSADLAVWISEQHAIRSEACHADYGIARVYIHQEAPNA